ncbi:hypothetical protein M231_05788 [Tremella mesenterica]|uniref:Uncharacterized protein n=1 Tax=Tremella mesenterica TaxID=5217 RepID=A0A4Q1BH88_TREME|nr:hypothetical protein M231_05788 [Tremella mesenterica]
MKASGRSDRPSRRSSQRQPNSVQSIPNATRIDIGSLLVDPQTPGYPTDKATLDYFRAAIAADSASSANKNRGDIIVSIPEETDKDAEFDEFDDEYDIQTPKGDKADLGHTSQQASYLGRPVNQDIYPQMSMEECISNVLMTYSQPSGLPTRLSRSRTAQNMLSLATIQPATENVRLNFDVNSASMNLDEHLLIDDDPLHWGSCSSCGTIMYGPANPYRWPNGSFCTSRCLMASQKTQAYGSGSI